MNGIKHARRHLKRTSSAVHTSVNYKYCGLFELFSNLSSMCGIRPRRSSGIFTGVLRPSVRAEDVRGGPWLRSTATGCTQIVPTVQTRPGQQNFAFIFISQWSSLLPARRLVNEHVQAEDANASLAIMTNLIRRRCGAAVILAMSCKR